MMYNEIKAGDIPILSFLKGTEYAMGCYSLKSYSVCFPAIS